MAGGGFCAPGGRSGHVRLAGGSVARRLDDRVAAGPGVPGGLPRILGGYGLFEELGLGQAPGTARLRAGGIRPRLSRRPWQWQDVAAEEVRAVSGLPWHGGMARAGGPRRSWAGGRPRGRPPQVRFSGSDEAEWALAPLRGAGTCPLGPAAAR